MKQKFTLEICCSKLNKLQSKLINGKPVAVVISADAYQSIETLKLHLLQSKAVKAITDIKMGNLVDGNTFFDELAAGQYD